MSVGLYSHTTRATGTVLTATIYNGDHVNHITNQNPLSTGAYSDNVGQMQAVTDPGAVGTESLAGSLGGELERLRFAIKRIAGGAQWYSAPALGPIVPPLGQIFGLTMSAPGASAIMTVAVGNAVDNTLGNLMTLLASTGKTTAAWAVGTGNGGLDTGAIATATWYHFFLIQRLDTGVVDVLFSLSPTTPTMPANYTVKRRIGAGKTDGSSQWIAFVQDGDYFRWKASVADVNTANPGTAAVLAPLSVPTGVNTRAFGDLLMNDGIGNNAVLLSDPAANDEAPTTLGPLTFVYQPTGTNGIPFDIRTNTSAQIRYRLASSNAGITIRLTTFGWIDTRGKNA